MKQIALLLIILITIADVQAQTPFKSRLIGVNREYWDNGAWVEQDSVSMSYSGGRGGDNAGTYEPNLFDALTLYTPDNAQWEPFVITERIYDGNHNIVTETEKNWNGTAWENDHKNEYAYNSYNLVTVFESYSWVSGAWELDNKLTNTYTNGTLLIKQENQYVGLGGQLENYARTTYEYDNNNFQLRRTGWLWDNGQYEMTSRGTTVRSSTGKVLLSIAEQELSGLFDTTGRTVNSYTAFDSLEVTTSENKVSGNWTFNRRSTYHYNSDNLADTLTGEEYYTNNAWTFDNRFITTYTSFQVFSTYMQQSWTGSGWENVQLTEHTYDANERIIENQRSNWDGTTWEPSSLFTTDYLNNDTEQQYSSFNWNGSSWDEVSRNTSHYNSYNQRTYYVAQQNSGGTLVNSSRAFYYYEDYIDSTSSGINSLQRMSTETYPNPFTQNVALSLTINDGGAYTLKVHNLAGQLVYTEERHLSSGQQNWIWEGVDTKGATVSQGIYFFNIVGNDGVGSGKWVKQ